MKKIKINSVGIYYPNEIVKSDDLLQEVGSDTKYGTAIDWMSEHMGIVERRMSTFDTKPSDLAIPAASSALEKMGHFNRNEIDMVVFCGIERDQPEPATAHVIQDALGLKAKHTFDIANACFGFVNGMELAANYIKVGEVKHALVVTGETPTKVMRSVVEELKSGVSIQTFRKKLGALSVGDAGGAVILGASEDESGFDIFNTASFSSHVDKCIYKWGSNGIVEGQMLMGPIVNAIMKAHKELAADTLEKLGWDNFDYVVSHQMGAKPFDKLSGITGLESSRMVKTYPRLGNITSATLAANFHKLFSDGKVKAGDRVGGYFAGSGLAIGQFGYTA